MGDGTSCLLCCFSVCKLRSVWSVGKGVELNILSMYLSVQVSLTHTHVFNSCARTTLHFFYLQWFCHALSIFMEDEKCHFTAGGGVA